jgi:hypothetical protein
MRDVGKWQKKSCEAQASQDFDTIQFNYFSPGRLEEVVSEYGTV